MKILLDTHVFLWCLDKSTLLKPGWREVIIDPNNLVFVSVVTPWEMSIKERKKRNGFHFKRPLESYFENLEFGILDIRLAHVQELHALPLYHKDPFDRILIAQARVEGCMLITIDKKMHKYDVPIL